MITECVNGYVLNGEREGGSGWSPSTDSYQNLVRYALKNRGYKFVEIPYVVLTEAGIPYKEVVLVSMMNATYRKVKYKDPKTGEEKEKEEHLLGACLIKDRRGRLYLSSTDDGAQWGWGYFLTWLKSNGKKIQNVEEAFDSMRPEEVKEAEKRGTPVERQGEWFFMHFGDTKFVKRNLAPLFPKGISLRNRIAKWLYLPAVGVGREAHHKVRDCIEWQGVHLCRGTIRHDENQHKMLKLGEDWWVAVHNIQERSWSHQARVD